MTAETDLLPLPMEAFTPAAEPAERRAAIRAYARACVSSATEALRADNERLRIAFDEQDEKASVTWYVKWVEQKRRAERLAEALQRLVNSFPEEGVLLDAGWDGAEVDEACEAYDAARTALDQETTNG